MGMFDYMTINTDLLPLKKKEKERIIDSSDWQTKSLYCELGRIVIRNNKELFYNGKFLKIDIAIRFYNFDANQVWWEFIAFFKKGILQEIKEICQNEEQK